PSRALDAGLGRAHPARPPDLQAEAAVRPLSPASGLRLLPLAWFEGPGTARNRPKPTLMNRDAFLKLVDEALASIPRRFRDAMTNIAIVVEDEPTDEQLADAGIEPPDTLLGLYEGIPLTERQWAHGNTLPDKITLFQGPIEDVSEDEDDMVVAIGETLIHEIGHYFGLSEEEIEAIEEQYWRGDFVDEDDAVE